MPALQTGAALVPFQVINPSTGNTAGGTARVDTGADITLIDASVLDYVAATSTGNIVVVGIDGVDQTLYEYVVSLNFGADGYVTQAKVVGLPGLQDIQGIQGLIGKDILKTGIFNYDGLTNTFTLQVGIGTGPPISPLPQWVLPAAVIATSLGLAGVLWMAMH